MVWNGNSVVTVPEYYSYSYSCLVRVKYPFHPSKDVLVRNRSEEPRSIVLVLVLVPYRLVRNRQTEQNRAEQIGNGTGELPYPTHGRRLLALHCIALHCIGGAYDTNGSEERQCTTPCRALHWTPH